MDELYRPETQESLTAWEYRQQNARINVDTTREVSVTISLGAALGKRPANNGITASKIIS